jgi:putative restriction endonuclease
MQKEFKNQFVVEEENLANRYGSEILTRVRLGQGAFRVLITDAYDRKCAICGERTLPVLDAAHIKPYDQSGPHAISNGLLLRSDIHKLFDKGYMTITHDYKIEVSKRIKQEFENGREYYRYHGNSLLTLPNRDIDKPSNQFIEWHNQNIYKG